MKLDFHYILPEKQNTGILYILKGSVDGNTWDYWAFGLCPLSSILEYLTMDKAQNPSNPN
jgi:hypothetical protein